MTSPLTHFDAQGQAHMVDVSPKAETHRVAVAAGEIRMQPETFARCRRNVLRLHYRSVMANDRRAPYDYFMMVAGPVPFSAWTTSPAGLLDFIAADGSCRGSSGRTTAATTASA